ncbi:MAG: response regulator transcription factor [Alphaproteobacteria bacterium]|nr:response regulator transcription factor [Alphaproteobacteria bacterium]
MNKTILIIDDDDILRDALAHGLRNEGFNVITANSAENANDILKRISVDGIVLDRMMTGMDGLSFLKKLRAAGNSTPTIMLTAMTGPENTIDGLSNGANDYLAKPFQIRELILRLNNITKSSATNNQRLPAGLSLVDDEFFINAPTPKVLALSGEEKKLLHNLISPIGNIVPAAPMVAKRLRSKINIVLSNLDIMTIRGQGYKLVDTTAPGRTNKGEKK